MEIWMEPRPSQILASALGMTPALRSRFEVLLSVPTGGDEILLLKKRTNPIPEEAP